MQRGLPFPTLNRDSQADPNLQALTQPNPNSQRPAQTEHNDVNEINAQVIVNFGGALPCLGLCLTFAGESKLLTAAPSCQVCCYFMEKHEKKGNQIKLVQVAKWSIRFVHIIIF